MTIWSNSELAALGGIVVTFSDMEFFADFLLVGFLSPGTGHLVTAGESMTWKLDKLSAVTAEVVEDQELRQQLNQWIKGARDLTDRRNQIMHSFYMVREGEAFVSRMKANTRHGRWKAHQEPMREEDLREFLDLLKGGVEVAKGIVDQLLGCPQWQGHQLDPEVASEDEA